AAQPCRGTGNQTVLRLPVVAKEERLIQQRDPLQFAPFRGPGEDERTEAYATRSRQPPAVVIRPATTERGHRAAALRQHPAVVSDGRQFLEPQVVDVLGVVDDACENQAPSQLPIRPT